MKPYRPLALLLCFLMAGCSDPSATVSGEITYEGQPVQDGFITFTPVDGKGKEGGGPIQSGKYTVSDLPAGKKVVRVTATKKVTFASTSAEMEQKAAEARKVGKHDGLVEPADIIPDNAVGNNQVVELKIGANTHNLALQKPAKK